MSQKKNDMTFEQAVKRLEEIADTLAAGNVELDAAISLFEEGVRLSDFCSAKLKAAQQKVTLISEKALQSEDRSDE